MKVPHRSLSLLLALGLSGAGSAAPFTLAVGGIDAPPLTSAAIAASIRARTRPYPARPLPNQFVAPLPGQIVPALPGQVVGALPGEIVPPLPGQRLAPLPGQIVRALPGQIVEPLPGQILR